MGNTPLPPEDMEETVPRDRRRIARTRLETLLREGLEDGADEADAADWASLRRELDQRIAGRTIEQ